MNDINTEYIELTFDAAVKAYWHKQPFRVFLKNCGVSDKTIGMWAPEETKKAFLGRIFERIRVKEGGPAVLSKMAKTLAEKTHYPDLENLEDSEFKLKVAKTSRDRLKSFLDNQKRTQKEEADAVESRLRMEALRKAIRNRESDLQKLEERLNTLAQSLGEQKAGYDFQDWFYDLMSYSEVMHKRPYKNEGRQIDGSVSIGGTHYLVELKFTQGQSSGEDIDSLANRVRSMADNTMGIFLSVSGYSTVAVNDASKSRVVLLLDVNHLYLALKDVMSFQDIVERVRRHASQTGKAYLPTNEFGH